VTVAKGCCVVGARRGVISHDGFGTIGVEFGDAHDDTATAEGSVKDPDGLHVCSDGSVRDPPCLWARADGTAGDTTVAVDAGRNGDPARGVVVWTKVGVDTSGDSAKAGLREHQFRADMCSVL